MSKLTHVVFDYPNMAGTATADDFKQLTKRERSSIYLKSLINPLKYCKGAISGKFVFANDLCRAHGSLLAPDPWATPRSASGTAWDMTRWPEWQ
jgi:hypothetical protein